MATRTSRSCRPRPWRCWTPKGRTTTVKWINLTDPMPYARLTTERAFKNLAARLGAFYVQYEEGHVQERRLPRETGDNVLVFFHAAQLKRLNVSVRSLRH